MESTKALRILGRLLLLALILCAAQVAARAPEKVEPIDPRHNNGPDRVPQPTTIDMITHNVGNIVTTLDNWGYIGGYQYYGYPSGEWPRNSGHDYIGELRYWMGAVTPGGDTLVANSIEDFQGVPMPVNGTDDHKIYLSTDTSRYFSYDPTDTVGLGTGNPANGWRVWDATQDDYVLNTTWDPLSTSYEPGGPTSLQESFYRFADIASGEPLLGLELTHTCMQWNYCYNENFTFVVLEITNTSDVDYADFAFGLYIDIDVGGPDGTGENGRLGDLVASDSSENLAWTYDEDAYDPGWGPTVTTGVMGTKYIETPDDIGMTSFRTGYWEQITDLDDAGMYEWIASDQYDESLPPTDQFYIQCTRGINLTAGRTVRIVYAIVAGEDEEDFKDNAQLAQSLYDNNFIGPQPPAPPILTARSGNGKVYLSWTDTSEVSPDPMTGSPDFVGYKLYRSDDRGATWGNPIYNTGNDCLDLDYKPLAQFTVNTPGDPVSHSFIDEGLINGADYWYCLVAFDGGDESQGIDPLQTGFGVAGESPHCVTVTPESDPAGFYDAAGTVEHGYTGPDLPSDGEIFPMVFDRAALTGADFEVSFEDQVTATVWHLVNSITGDTVLANQSRLTGDPELYPIAEGLRVVVRDGDPVPRSYGQSEFAGVDTTMPVMNFYGPSIPAVFSGVPEIWSNRAFRPTYELRYTGDSTRATWFLDGYYETDYIYWVPFECWNTTTNQRVSLAVWDYDANDVWDIHDDLAIIEYAYDSVQSVTPQAFPYYYGWLVQFDTVGFNPQVGDVFQIEGAPLNGPDDAFSFAVDGVNASMAGDDLKNILVVPNPYYAYNHPMIERQDGESVLRFVNVPEKCVVRIYSLAGDLVETLNHSGSGDIRWDLQSSNGQQVASGVYLFHVESDFGQHLGRFSVVK